MREVSKVVLGLSLSLKLGRSLCVCLHTHTHECVPQNRNSLKDKNETVTQPQSHVILSLLAEQLVKQKSFKRVKTVFPCTSSS